MTTCTCGRVVLRNWCAWRRQITRRNSLLFDDDRTARTRGLSPLTRCPVTLKWRDRRNVKQSMVRSSLFFYFRERLSGSFARAFGQHADPARSPCCYGTRDCTWPTHETLSRYENQTTPIDRLRSTVSYTVRFRLSTRSLKSATFTVDHLPFRSSRVTQITCVYWTSCYFIRSFYSL